MKIIYAFIIAIASSLPIGIILASEYPILKIKHPSEEEQLTYRDHAFIEGEFSAGFKEVFIKDQIISFSYNRKSRFSKRIFLDKGKNEIIVRGTTVSGKYVSQKVEITRKLLLDIVPPSKLAINDFKRTPENIKTYVTQNLENDLKSAMKRYGRFEIGISDSDSDYILTGMIRERPKGIEISVDLKDSKTNEYIIKIADAYSEDIGKDISEELAKRIIEKLNEELPIREGIVLETRDNRIAIDFGIERNIKKGMKVMIYEIIIKKSESGKLLDLTMPLGQATIQEVNQGASWASLNKVTDNVKIRYGNIVIIQ